MSAISPDLIGRTFGRLTVLQKLPPDRGGNVLWRCVCECGGAATPRTNHLVSGATVSCGCRHREVSVENGRKFKHGQYRTPAYRSWITMRSRCSNPKDSNFKWYGARGIRVCERWDSFENFLSDMGERPEGMTLDRIDPNGNYEPDNCRWATSDVQAANKRPFRRAKVCEQCGAGFIAKVWNQASCSEPCHIARRNRLRRERYLRLDPKGGEPDGRLR